MLGFNLRLTHKRSRKRALNGAHHHVHAFKGNAVMHFAGGFSGTNFTCVRVVNVASIHALRGVSFSVSAGETLALVGESGSGKSTAARAIVRLVQATHGSISFNGQSVLEARGSVLHAIRRNLQIVFQDPNAALNPRLSILDSVVEPLQIAGSGSAESRQAAALAALSRVGLAREYASRYPHQLSGGQKQRVNIARVLTLRPKLIVCDEVVAALDVSIRGDILNLFADLQRELGLTYVFITHDLSVVSHISDRIAVMYLGRLLELGPTDELSDRPLHPYTQALLSAEPVPLPAALRTARRIVLEGEIPSPISPPSGCRFRTRCRHAIDACARTVPPWREIEPQRFIACHLAEQLAASPPD